MNSKEEQRGRIDISWVYLGVAGGLTACVAYPLLVFAPLLRAVTVALPLSSVRLWPWQALVSSASSVCLVSRLLRSWGRSSISLHRLLLLPCFSCS